MILLIDNYDSFAHNLARYLRQLGEETVVVRNDAVSLAEIEEMAPSRLVISPGPCTPREAGISGAAVAALAPRMPVLGVCLGHQCIAEVFGGETVRAERPVHGRSWTALHSGVGIFAGLPSPLRVGRYHSLVVRTDTLPACLEPVATTPEGELMAFRHRELATWGVQFHPESVLTEHGYDLLRAFLRLPVPVPAGAGA